MPDCAARRNPVVAESSLSGRATARRALAARWLREPPRAPASRLPHSSRANSKPRDRSDHADAMTKGGGVAGIDEGAHLLAIDPRVVSREYDEQVTWAVGHFGPVVVSDRHPPCHEHPGMPDLAQVSSRDGSRPATISSLVRRPLVRLVKSVKVTTSTCPCERERRPARDVETAAGQNGGYGRRLGDEAPENH